jgi:hypothetical protein
MREVKRERTAPEKPEPRENIVVAGMVLVFQTQNAKRVYGKRGDEEGGWYI